MKSILLLALFISISCYFQGIDVSTYQDNIDWYTVAENNHFAIIRAGYGFGHIDDFYQRNYQNAKAAGVKVGAYWYSYASSINDAIEEANYFVQALAGKQFEWPVYYDIEERSIFNLGIASDIAKAFCDVLERNRYYCGIYSSTNAFDNYFDDYVKQRYTIWLAHWDVDVPSYQGRYDVWQYHVGTTPGISGQCDLDRGYLDFEPVMKENGLNGY